MSSELGAWLRQQREARNWSRREMARQLIQAGKACGDTSLPSVGSMYHNVRRWERGESGLTERYKLYYCKILGIPPERFGPHASSTGSLPPAAATATAPAFPAQPPAPPPADVHPAAPHRADPGLLAAIAVAYRGIYGSDMGDFPVEREVLMAAHEASDHAEQRGISDPTLEQLRADVTRLATLADAGEPLAIFLDMRRVRDQIYRLQDRRLGPGEQTDLYFLLACLNGLMGITAHYLGYPDAAEELHRAGWAYADAIDHHPLMARLRCELAYIAYYRGRFEESRDLARSGLGYLSIGPGGAHLHTIHARAAARLGDVDTARQAVHDAHEAFERDYDDDLLKIGGQYAISKATHYYHAGHALTLTAGAEDEAAEELEHAIGLYDEGPGQGEDHWFAGKPLAGINLAVVRLRSGALDAAAEALQPALSLPVAQRISDVTTRLAAVRDELAAPIYRGSPQTRELGTQIEEFGRETIVAGLHSLPGGAG